MASNLENLKTYLGVTGEDVLLTLLISQADSKIIKKRYPFGASEEQKALALIEYADIEFDIALYLYNKQGAEGQKSHSENGISRSYNEVDDLLSGIMPFAGVI